MLIHYIHDTIFNFCTYSFPKCIIYNIFTSSRHEDFFYIYAGTVENIETKEQAQSFFPVNLRRKL